MSSRTKAPLNFYTLGEEIANSITHAIAIPIALVGLLILVILAIRAGSLSHLITYTVFGSTLTLTFLTSTLYHASRHPALKRILQVVDHAAIYLLIAGTYTPYLLISIRGHLGWSMLVVIWLLAILGITFKAFFINRYEVMATLTYVGMGWLCIFLLQRMITQIPIPGLQWLFAGGVAYTFGVIFFAWNKLPYNHAIWHLFVITGGFCHYQSIMTLLP